MKYVSNYEGNRYIGDGVFNKPDLANTFINSKLNLNEEAFTDKKQWHQNY